MNFQKYILKNKSGWRFENVPVRTFKNAIVIPVCAESECLPLTLESLADNPGSVLGDTLVILVVNNPPPESPGSSAKFAENRETLRLLRNSHFPFQKELNLSWIDASAPGFEINPKEGVGAARKIGMDKSLEFLDFSGASPIIISLDADTLVERNYLAASNGYFSANPDKAGATMNFEHQPGDRRGSPGPSPALVGIAGEPKEVQDSSRLMTSAGLARHRLGAAGWWACHSRPARMEDISEERPTRMSLH